MVRFVVAALVLLAFYFFPYPEGSFPTRLLEAYLSFTARAAGALLSLVGADVRVDGMLIHGRFPLRIVQSCDGAEAVILLLAAIVAWPADNLRRLAGAVVGAAAVLSVNLVRIASLFFIGVARRDQFEVAHAHVWPLALLAVTAGCFLAWTRWARAAGARKAGERR